MKIEKVNDHQIRCTLTKSDLAERELKISELAYGTEKAKGLFRDMMQQASYQFGFEADDIPLMIEAIPISGEAIVLIITKVEDPEELDTRFSRFSPSIRSSETEAEVIADDSGADDILDALRRVSDPAPEKAAEGGELEISVPREIVRVYSFDDLEGATLAAHIVKGYYRGRNSLYRNPADGRVLLTVYKSDHSPEQFNKVCNMLAEYGRSEKMAVTQTVYYEEHLEPIISNNALQQLVNI